MADVLMSPLQAIETNPPNVWLTSFYGFDPSNWGYLGFSTDAQRNSFIRRSAPGVLVVIYGVGSAPKDQLGRIIGLIQCSHRVNNAQAFMSPLAWKAKQANKDRAGRWELGIKAVRAWRFSPESQIPVGEFAPETYRPDRGQVIGSQGMPLTSTEAKKLLALDFSAVRVFGDEEIIASAVGPGSSVLAVSKAGPVSQSSFVVKEAEGPKSLYILRLEGCLRDLLGREVGELQVIKVGISKSPQTRCLDHNKAWPQCAFCWVVEASNEIAGIPLFPDSKSAIAGENEMKRVLAERGTTLGGEFFLATESAIEEAWKSGIDVAQQNSAAF